MDSRLWRCLIILFHQLYVFTKVVEEKSFSKAAKSIYLSQSTVSTHISNLEKHFGQKLFDRFGKEIALSSFGEKLYPWGREILLLRERALFDLLDYNVRIEGHIKLAASTVPANYMVPRLISKFSIKYPDIRFTLDMLSSYQAAEMLAKGKADVAFLGFRHYASKLKYIPIMEEKLVIITPSNMNLAVEVSIKELIEYPFLFRKYGSGTQDVLEKMLRKANVDINKLKVIGNFDSVQVLKQCVKEGMGISIISEIAASDYVSSKFINAYELKEIPEKRTFYIAYSEEKTMSPFLDLFINYCSAYKWQEDSDWSSNT